MVNKFTKYGTGVVLGHALVATAHGSAHAHLGVSLTLGQKVFVLTVITLAPLVSMVLLWTPMRRPAAALLFLSMAGSLIFGVAYHFVIVSNDHVLHLPPGEWQITFQLTAVFLFITELCGCWIGGRAWQAFKAEA